MGWGIALLPSLALLSWLTERLPRAILRPWLEEEQEKGTWVQKRQDRNALVHPTCHQEMNTYSATAVGLEGHLNAVKQAHPCDARDSCLGNSPCCMVFLQKFHLSGWNALNHEGCRGQSWSCCPASLQEVFCSSFSSDFPVSLLLCYVVSYCYKVQSILCLFLHRRWHLLNLKNCVTVKCFCITIHNMHMHKKQPKSKPLSK